MPEAALARSRWSAGTRRSRGSNRRCAPRWLPSGPRSDPGRCLDDRPGFLQRVVAEQLPLRRAQPEDRDALLVDKRPSVRAHFEGIHRFVRLGISGENQQCCRQERQANVSPGWGGCGDLRCATGRSVFAGWEVHHGQFSAVPGACPVGIAPPVPTKVSPCQRSTSTVESGPSTPNWFIVRASSRFSPGCGLHIRLSPVALQGPPSSRI